MDKRLFKKTFYFLFFVLIFFGLIYGIYLATKSRPTCFDGKKNQGEEGIDCGGPCRICLPENFRDIEVSDVKFKNINNKLILLAKIQNRNEKIASQHFEYKFNIWGENNLIKSVIGESFIYAEEIKYINEIVEYNLNDIKKVTLEILNPIWVKADAFKRPNINLLDKTISKNQDGIGVSGKIINNDFVYFKDVKILVNFYDKNERWLGSSKTLIDFLDVGEIKQFKVIFPQHFDLNDLQSEIIIDTKRK